jgi:hypothetical protein
MISKDRLVFDVANLSESDNIGAFVRSATGEVIDSQTIAATEWLQVASALHDGSGNALSSTGGALDVNITNGLSVDLDGVYDGATNLNPDNVGMIAHVRAASPGDAQQTFRSTGGAASADDVVAADVQGLDVNAFGMVFDGTTWDRLRGTAGAVHVSDAGGSLTVDATDLDIRDLDFATDSIDVSGSSVSISGDVNVTQGTSPWVVGDGGGSLTVDAVDLDIRDLAFATDSVTAHQGGSWTVTADAGAGTFTVSDAALANTAIANAASNTTTTASAIPASALANRKYVFIQNLGNRSIFLGGASVTTANGLRLSPGSVLEARIGAAVSVYRVTDSGTQDTRILELA